MDRPLRRTVCELSILTGALPVLILLRPFASRAEELPTAADWVQIRHTAAFFVARESLPGVLPFESPADAVPRAAPHTTLCALLPALSMGARQHACRQ